MINYPQINPVAFNLGPLQIHWYGLTYLFGFFLAWILALYRIKHFKLNWTKEELSDLIFYSALGVILGGRLGFMLFYNMQEFMTDPLSLFKVWQGGMSFHGGLLGVITAIIVFSLIKKKKILQVMDFVAPLVPLGLAAGRIGNFINGELWGRPTSLAWGIIFPRSDMQPRHPSQLYEFFLEGILLFILVWWYASKPRPTGRITALFLIGYAFSRIICEFFREPDLQIGFIAFNWLTMGQILSIPMLIIGLILWWIKKNEKLPQPHRTYFK